jgi:hypothetical protein
MICKSRNRQPEPQGATVPVQSEIIAAIRERRIVEFRDGGGYRRIGEPHLLGVCAETGTTQIEMFQTDGETPGQRDHLKHWRRFAVDDIWSLETTGVGFVPRQDFNRHSPQWSEVIASVSD